LGVLPTGKRLQVFSIKELSEKNGEEKKTVWVKAGSAWVNRDGSLNVYLDVLPLDGKLHVREALEDKRDSSNNKSSSANGSSTQEATMADSMGGH
jgi:hypothetical protein